MTAKTSKKAGRPKTVQGWGTVMNYGIKVDFSRYPQLHSFLFCLQQQNQGDILEGLNQAVMTYIREKNLPLASEEECGQIAMQSVKTGLTGQPSGLPLILTGDGEGAASRFQAEQVETAPTAVTKNREALSSPQTDIGGMVFDLVGQESPPQAQEQEQEQETVAQPANLGSLLDKLSPEQLSALFAQAGIQPKQKADGLSQEEQEAAADLADQLGEL